MTKKPFYFSVLSAVIFMIVLSIPVQVMYLYEHPIQDFSAAMELLPWNNWLLMSFGMVLSVQMFLVHPNLKYSIPVFCLLGVFNNLMVGFADVDFSLIETSTASLGLLSLFVPLLTPEHLKLLQDSRMRWWLSATRAEVLVPVQVEVKNKQILGLTYDLSDTGVFLTFSSTDQLEREFDKLEQIDFKMKIGQLESFHCQAHVVRISQDQRGAYPAGIGLRFANTTETQRQALRNFVKKQSEHLSL